MDLLKLDTMKWTFGTYLDRPLERKMCFSLLILKSRHKMCTHEKNASSCLQDYDFKCTIIVSLTF